MHAILKKIWIYCIIEVSYHFDYVEYHRRNNVINVKIKLNRKCGKNNLHNEQELFSITQYEWPAVRGPGRDINISDVARAFVRVFQYCAARQYFRSDQPLVSNYKPPVSLAVLLSVVWRVCTVHSHMQLDFENWKVHGSCNSLTVNFINRHIIVIFK